MISRAEGGDSDKSYSWSSTEGRGLKEEEVEEEVDEDDEEEESKR